MAEYSLVRDEPEGYGMRYNDEGTNSFDNNLLLGKVWPHQAKKTLHRRHHLIPIILHSVFFCFNLMFCFAIWRWAGKDFPYGIHGPDLVYSELEN